MNTSSNNTAAISAELERIVALIGDNHFIIRSQWEGGDDPVDGFSEGGKSTDVVGIEEIIKKMRVFSSQHAIDVHEILSSITDKNFIRIINEYFFDTDEQKLISYQEWADHQE